MQINNDIEQIIETARELKFKSLTEHSLITLLKQTKKEVWSTEKALYEIFSLEVERKNEERKKSRIRRAQFNELKYLQELVVEELPEDMNLVLPELQTLKFIKEKQNIILSGNPGTGKTHVAIGLGIKACLKDYSVLFTTIPRLITEIRESKSEKRLRQLELKFERYDLVICDEFGYVSFNKEAAELLFNHLSIRTGKKATIITTNLTFDRWNEIFDDPILTAAMVDRLTHKAYLINMNGESYRTKETIKLLKKRKERRKI